MSKCRSDDAERLAAMFQALSSTQRLRVFIKLMNCCPPGECSALSLAGMRQCVGDLGKDLGLAASTVSYHLKELRQAGLMQVERRGKTVECWIDQDAVRLLAAFFTASKGVVICGGEVAAREDDVAACGAEVAAREDEVAACGGERTV
jgi:ArsR family transcriptional regulator, arsenate/arsenite/antimonite-responsive transcriptional repressor